MRLDRYLLFPIGLICYIVFFFYVLFYHLIPFWGRPLAVVLSELALTSIIALILFFTLGLLALVLCILILIAMIS